jgi:flagellar M-ring protein FliF
VSREEKFDPMSQVERSKQLQNDQETSDETKPRDPVSVGQNLPNQNAPQGDGTAKTSSSTTRNGQTINYEISSIRSERIREPGDVRRMTVAVLVDGIKDASGAFQPRPEEELARFSELVQAGVGFDAKRGDRVTVEAMQFLAGEPQGVVADAEAITPMYSNLPLMLGAALVILLLVGGFLVMQMRSRHKLELARVGGALTTVMPGGQQMVVAAGGTTTTTLTALSPEQRLTALQHAGAEGPISLDAQALAIEDRVEGDPAQSDLPLLALFDLVDSRPDEALAVIRSWIDGRDA